MLDVERGENINAGIEYFLHVLPAFRMTRAGGVGVRQFIYERKLRATRKHRVEVHFGECDAAMLQGAARYRGQPLCQRISFLATMRLDITDYQIASSRKFAPRGFEHGVGFPHARRHTKKHFEPTALLRGFLTLDRT